MAQNVGTPRFYVSVFQWLDAMGMMAYDSSSRLTGKTPKQLVHINPTSQATFSYPPSEIQQAGKNVIIFTCGFNYFKNIMANDKNFYMLLGHNLGGNTLVTQFTNDQGEPLADDFDENDVNYSNGVFERNGFSISHGNNAHEAFDAFINLNFGSGNSMTPDFEYKIGSILYGTYFDMPHSPDLSLKMSVEMDGVKNIQTKGGAALSNVLYTKPADWGDNGAWQLGDYPNFRHGRRSWDLSFSYLSDTDIMAKVAASSANEAFNADGTEIVDPYDPIAHTLRTESDFFSVVWNRTMGGHLPFVFQPDGNNKNPDQFAICRFDMSSLQYAQVANNVYNVKLKIRESW